MATFPGPPRLSWTCLVTLATIDIYSWGYFALNGLIKGACLVEVEMKGCNDNIEKDA
jgi:hypothetical protein